MAAETANLGLVLNLFRALRTLLHHRPPGHWRLSMAGSPVRFQMEGVKELKAGLEELGEVTATKVGARANREAAVELRDNLRAVAPYDPAARERPYGHLRDEIKVRKVKAR